MKNFRSAFTVIELIFVIVILGILAGVAIPRLMGNRDDATIAKLRGDVASIRSGLSLKRSADMMRGVTTWPEKLDDGSGKALFGDVLQTPIYEKVKTGWSRVSGQQNKYQACIKEKLCTTFTYYPKKEGNNKAGTFDCNHDDTACKKIAE